MLFPILPGPNRLGYATAKATIRESLSARYSVYYKDRHLPAKLLPARTLVVPRPIKPPSAAAPPATSAVAPASPS